MAKKRLLMVLSSHDEMGISGLKTGNWYDEVATPYYKFRAAGFGVTLASPRGGVAPIDPLSREEAFTTDHTRQFDTDEAAQWALAHTFRFNDIDVNDFAAVFFPGGYGQQWDMSSDLNVIRAIESWVAREIPVALVCHAPSILRDARKKNGEPLVKGLNVTGFTDAEDEELDVARHLLFSVEKMLIANGGKYKRSSKNWEPNVAEDGALLTGQNPASAAPLADRLIARLGK